MTQSPSKPRLQLRLIDAMGLIAVVALILVLTKSYAHCHPALNELTPYEPYHPNGMGIREKLYACEPTLVLISVALAPLRLTRSYRRWRRTARLPGLMVSYAAWAALVLALVRGAFDFFETFQNIGNGVVGFLSPLDVFALRVVMMKDMIGAGVAVSWLVLWIGGGWRTERSGTDRLGRFLGVLWILIGLATWVDYIRTP